MHGMPDDRSLLTLPPDLPVPEDDGAAAHLPGRALPPVRLPSTQGAGCELASLGARAVVFAYPRTGSPGEPPGADWDAIPGARGCTPEVCSIRDSIAAFERLGVGVAGLSAQTPEEQAEAARRLGLPYPLLSDAGGELAAALELPSFEWQGRRLLKRLTLLLRDGAIAEVIYPVFPPDGAAAAALARLESWQD
jgi:peroxiredoxin